MHKDVTYPKIYQQNSPQLILHDISSNLTALSASLEMLSSEINHELMHSSRSTVEEIGQLVNLARQNYSLRDSVQQKSVVFSATEEITNVLLAFRGKLQRDQIKLIHEDFDFAASLRGDPTRFRRVVVNLVSNSIDAINTGSVYRRELRVSVSRDDASKSFTIKFSDSGCGFKSKAQIKRALESGYTTKTAGSGLGLRIVKSIVEEEFQGTVNVANCKAGGTEVVLRFSMADI